MPKLLTIPFLLLSGYLAAQAVDKNAREQLSASVPAIRNPDSILHWFFKADAFMEIDRYDSAEYWLGKVGDRLEFKKPGTFNYYYHARQAEVFYYNNLVQLGMQQANRAYQIAEALGDSIFMADASNFLGLFALNLEKYAVAEAYLRRALRLMGNHPTAKKPLALSEAYHMHGNLGETYTRMRRYEKALEQFDSSRIKAALRNNLRAEALAMVSAGEALFEQKGTAAAQELLVNGIDMARQNRDYDVAMFGYGVLALQYVKRGNTAPAYRAMEAGKQLRETYAGLNPFYSLQYLRKAGEALELAKDYRGMALVQKEILNLERAVRRKNNEMIENVLSTGLRNENKLLQLEIADARLKQSETNAWLFVTLLIIALMVVGILYYRRTLKQKLAMAAIREKISRNLHDDIGATISSLHIYSELAQTTLQQQPDRTRDLLHRISQESKTLMENMNDMVWSMKSGEQDAMPLATRIKNFGAELMQARQINCRYKMDEEAFRQVSNFENRRHILLILKEALNNIAKYSEAANAEIALEKAGRKLRITVADDGCGFDIAANPSGNGLRNMKARAALMGGIFQIHTAKGKGTSIVVEIPVP